MWKKKENTFMKWFTIILILIFLIGTLWTGAMVMFWPLQAPTSAETSK